MHCTECPTAASTEPPLEGEGSPVVDAPNEAGVAGSSARREYERGRARDEGRLRQKWGKLGGIAVALFPVSPCSTRALDTLLPPPPRLQRMPTQFVVVGESMSPHDTFA